MDQTTEYILFSERELLREVALVVLLIDGYSGGSPKPEAGVVIKGSRYPAIRNLSGHHVFTRIPRMETFELQVSCPGFFPGTLTLTPGDLALLEPKRPVVTLTLEPLPSYPFPSGATLIRGMVRDTESRPVPDARVEAEGKTTGTYTTHEGEFVLFFTGITEEEVQVEQGEKWLVFNGTKEIIIIARKDSITGEYRVPAISEGKTTVLPGPIVTG